MTTDAHSSAGESTRITSEARNALIGAERLDEEQIEALETDAPRARE